MKMLYYISALLVLIILQSCREKYDEGFDERIRLINKRDSLAGLLDECRNMPREFKVNSIYKDSLPFHNFNSYAILTGFSSITDGGRKEISATRLFLVFMDSGSMIIPFVDNGKGERISYETVKDRMKIRSDGKRIFIDSTKYE